MTNEQKASIDAMSYEEMFRLWRFAPVGHPYFQGEVGNYFAERMKKMREAPGGQEEHVRASKSIGWEP